MALVQHVRHNTPRRMLRSTVAVRVEPVPPVLHLVQRRRRVLRWFALSMTVLFMLGVGAAWFQTQLARRQVLLDDLDRQVRVESERYDTLRLQRGELLAPAALMTNAINAGMEAPSTDEYLTLNADILAYLELFAPQPRPHAPTVPADELEQIGAVKAAVGDGP